MDKDGLLPIPEGLPFSIRDELVARRGEIKRLRRLLDKGKLQDGDQRISAESLIKKTAEFNARVNDFS